MRSLPHCCRPGALVAALISVACFAGIWGVKAAVIGSFGSSLPYWDQWAKEGELVIAPFLERGELLRPLLKPHSEHYIAPTLATNLLLVRLTGEWNARTQTLVNAALHAVIGAALIFWILTTVPAPRNAWGVTVVLGLVALPLGWENVVGGFQSQFYFLIGFSLLAIRGFICADHFGRRWALGLLCGLLACVSMGSGSFWIVPTFLALLAGPRSTQPRSYRWVNLALLTAIGLTAVWFRPPAPWHEPLHAKGGPEFLQYFVRCLSWPHNAFPGGGVLLWLPLGWIAWRRIRSRGAEPEGNTWFILSIGLWSLMQVAAVAYARGAMGAPVSRYGDVFAIGLIASFAALLLARPPGTRSRSYRAAVIGWAGLCLILATLAAHHALTRDLPAWSNQMAAHRETVRAFIATGDDRKLSEPPMPFPDPEWFARILRRPSVRSILPGHALVGDDAPTRQRLMAGGLALAVTGFALAGVLLVRCVLRERHARNPVAASPPC